MLSLRSNLLCDLQRGVASCNVAVFIFALSCSASGFMYMHYMIRCCFNVPQLIVFSARRCCLRVLLAVLVVGADIVTLLGSPIV